MNVFIDTPPAAAGLVAARSLARRIDGEVGVTADPLGILSDMRVRVGTDRAEFDVVVPLRDGPPDGVHLYEWAEVAAESAGVSLCGVDAHGISLLSRPAFVVTGVARSGTGYAARVLTAYGAPCGHEAIFGLRITRLAEPDPVAGDSSWLAAPLLGRCLDAPVVLQTRNPVLVVRSLLSSWPWTSRGEYGAYLRHHSAKDALDGNPAAVMARHWIDWNARIAAARPALHVRVEDLRERIADVGRAIGRELNVGALRDVPTDANARPKTSGFSLGDLPCALRDEFVSAAEAFGYGAGEVEDV